MTPKKSRFIFNRIEIIIAVIFAAIMVGVCLYGFAFAGNYSGKSSEKELAAKHAAEVIETCKAFHGDLKEVAETLSGTLASYEKDGSGRIMVNYKEDDLVVDLSIDPKNTSDVLTKADIKVKRISEEFKDDVSPVYTVQVAWQKQKQTEK